MKERLTGIGLSLIIATSYNYLPDYGGAGPAAESFTEAALGGDTGKVQTFWPREFVKDLPAFMEFVAMQNKDCRDTKVRTKKIKNGEKQVQKISLGDYSPPIERVSITRGDRIVEVSIDQKCNNLQVTKAAEIEEILDKTGRYIVQRFDFTYTEPQNP